LYAGQKFPAAINNPWSPVPGLLVMPLMYILGTK